MVAVFLRWLAILGALLLCAPGMAADGGSTQFYGSTQFHEVIALSYHDVRDDTDGALDPDQTAVDSRRLAAQFEWLRQNGYTPVSIRQLQEADAGKPLPAKAVLLTFDDGYRSFYTRVFPLLKLYGYPAVMALVGSWLDVPAGKFVQYGDEKLPRESFLTAQQIREMQASGLIEFASHSYNLHRGVTGNPQGNVQPAAVTAMYDPANGQYESPAMMEARVRGDLERNHRRLRELTGVEPRVMVWPYGEWNLQAERVARDLGYEWFLLLGDQAKPDKSMHRITRRLVESNPKMPDFIELVRPSRPPFFTVRAAQVALDHIYDGDPVRMNANIDRLLERIKRLHISVVYLQAYSDPGQDGAVDAVYFPNRHLPVRADLFNRVVWQLGKRADVRVYAAMPVIGYNSIGEDTVRIREVFRDLAQHASFTGVLFSKQGGEQLVQSLLADVKYFRPEIRSARSVDMRDLAGEIPQHDYLVVMPASCPEPAYTHWLSQHRDKAVIGLPVRDTADFRQQVALWKRTGHLHYAWYPDDFATNEPDAAAVFRLLSLEDFPYERR